MPSKGRDLEREVFGGSESELSSDDDDQDIIPQDDNEPLSSAYSDDKTTEVSTEKKKKKKKLLKKKDATSTDVVPRLSKKRKRKQPVQVDLSQLPPEQANKLRLDMKIDEILLRSKKSSRPRKKKSSPNTQVLDSFADDEVARLREAMNAAAEEDIKANLDKIPALSKLRLLNEVGDTLRKASLAQSIIDNNLLDAVRRFLEPLPDRSLPALSIQRTLFSSLRKMEWIDTSALKESGLGRIVLFYTKCKTVERDVARVAKELVEGWSRPIVGRSKEYRDRVVPVVGERRHHHHHNHPHVQGYSQGGEKLRLAGILARAKEEENRPGARRVRKNAVSIPQRELGTYVVAPADEMGLGAGGAGGVGRSVEMDVERRRKNAERLRSLTRKVAGGAR